MEGEIERKCHGRSGRRVATGSGPTAGRSRLILARILSGLLLVCIAATVVLLLMGRDATWAAGIGGAALTGLLAVLAWPYSA